MPGRQKNSPTGATRLDKTAEKPAASSGASSPSDPAVVTAPSAGKAHQPRPGAKNRPTPKRKDQEAARRKPIVVTDRKAAKEAEKQRAREARMAARAAADRGEDHALPARDRGPEKRFIRDCVDARTSIGEFAIPLMLIAVVATLIPNTTVKMLAFPLVWIFVLALVIDWYLMWRRIRKALVAKFGAVPPRSGRHAFQRCSQIRRTRYPRPMVERGAKVL